MPEAFAISPAGMISAPTYTTPTTAFSSMGSLVVAQIVPGLFLRTAGVGETPIASAAPLTRGTMEVQYITGTAGSAQALALFEPVESGLTGYRFGMAVDSTNRPFVLMYDAIGNVVGRTTPSGSAIPVGVRVVARLAWDSTQAIQGVRFASFRVNGQFVPSGEWTTNPTVTWAPMLGGVLEAGMAYTTQTLSDFAGTLLSIQAGNGVVP